MTLSHPVREVLAVLTEPPQEASEATPSATLSDALGHLVQGGGSFGWVAIVVAVCLIIYGGLLIALRPPRRAFVLLGFLALVPPLIGGAGTWFTDRGIQREVHAAELRGESVTAPDVAKHRDRAEIPLKVGLVATSPVVALVLLGLAFPRRQKEIAT